MGLFFLVLDAPYVVYINKKYFDRNLGVVYQENLQLSLKYPGTYT